MLLECKRCGGRYDVSGRPPGEPVRSTCGNILFVPHPRAGEPLARVEAFLQKYQAVSGIPMDRCRVGPGEWEFPFGSARVRLSVDSEDESFRVSSRLIRVPDNLARRAGMLDALMGLNARKTREARFAVEDGHVVVVFGRPLEGLDYPEFTDALASVCSTADDYDDWIKAEYGGFAAGSAAGAGAVPAAEAEELKLGEGDLARG